MSGPVQTCQLCGRTVAVTPDGRGFPPDIAKRKLKRLCSLSNCASDPKYTAGFAFGGHITGQEASE